MQTKIPYVQPELKTIGNVADLTKTGKTRPGSDAKGGSVTHSQGQ